MTKNIARALPRIAAPAAAALAATALAACGTSSSASSPAAGAASTTTTPAAAAVPGGAPGAGGPGGGTPVIGTPAANVKAAVLAKYPGGRIEQILKAADGTYVAHVFKSDGTEVHVALDKSFKITGTQAGGPGGAPGAGGPGGGTPVIGTPAAEVKAAVLARYPGGRIEQILKASDGTYAAHVFKASGAEVHVTLDKAFKITGTQAGGPGGPPPGTTTSPAPSGSAA